MNKNIRWLTQTTLIIIFIINILLLKISIAGVECSFNAEIKKQYGIYYIHTSLYTPNNDYKLKNPFKIEYTIYVNSEYLIKKTYTHWLFYGDFYDEDIKIGKKPPIGYYVVKLKIYDSNNNLLCEDTAEAGTISKSFWDDPIVKYAAIIGIFIVINAIIREYIRSYYR